MDWFPWPCLTTADRRGQHQRLQQWGDDNAAWSHHETGCSLSAVLAGETSWCQLKVRSENTANLFIHMPSNLCVEIIWKQNNMYQEWWLVGVLYFAILCPGFQVLHVLNTQWPSDTIWRHRSGSTLAQVMACCLTTPSHCLNQCWLIIHETHLHSSEDSFTRETLHLSQ